MNAKGMDDIESRAAHWILQYDRGEVSPKEQTDLETWLAADSRHRSAYLRLEQAWRCSAALKVWRPRDGSLDEDVLTASKGLARPWHGNIRTRVLAAAAALAIVVGLVWFPLTGGHSETFVTQVGGYQRVLLPDGSVLQLNTDSEARVHFTEKARQVHLVRGEAHFQIAHDARHAFDVRAAGTVVEALGTAFSVRLREQEQVEVIVTEGRVALRTEEASAAGREHVAGAAAAVPVVSAGEAADAKPNGFVVHRMDEAERNRRLAWQTGKLAFHNQALAQVVSEFNRYNFKQIRIVDPDLAHLQVGGNFASTDLESFVAAMRSALGVRVEETDDQIRLYAP